MKIFISYSTEDKPIAESLYDDMSEAGAEVFEFGRSETIGKPSWEEVLSWISESDVFVVLVSKSANSSRAVKEEIEQANYSYINKGKPGKLIPAIIEKGAKPPILIERFSRVDLKNYKEGVRLLIKQLGLKKGTSKPTTRPTFTIPSSFDFDQILADYKKPNPELIQRKRWSGDAAKILSNYSKVKPTGISKKDEAKHIDSILAGLSEKRSPSFSSRPSSLLKLDTAFYGFEPSKGTKEKDEEHQWPELGSLLLNYDSSKRFDPLEPPKLKSPFASMLDWSAVPGAVGYVLEESSSPAFTESREVYSGRGTSYFTFPTFGLLDPLSLAAPYGARYYRVKAKAGVFRPDSPWSNTVKQETKPPKPLPSPELSASSTSAGTTLSWSPVEGASGYVLERSVDVSFSAPSKIYERKETNHVDTSGSIFLRMPYSYRVKAKGLLRPDSPWSKSVESEPTSLSGIFGPKNLWTAFLEPPTAKDFERLPRPTLEASQTVLGTTLTWPAVKGAEGYVLEHSADSSFIRAEQIYDGKKTAYFDTVAAAPFSPPISLSSLSASPAQYHYRVKAKGGVSTRDSDWSETVTPKPKP